MKDRDLRRAARLWSDEARARYYAGGGLTWYQLPAAQLRLNQKISGDPQADWMDHLARTHLAGRLPVGRCLSLGCGQGWVERELAGRGIVEQCLGYDISERNIERARAHAAEEGLAGLEYQVQDVNSVVLPEGEYDLVVAVGALHHLTDLEHVLEQVNRALQAEGLFAFLEYVGPSRLDYPQRQLELADCVLRLLPERLRRSVSWERHGRIGPGARRSARDWLRLAWRKLRNRTLGAALVRRMQFARLRKAGGAYVKDSVPRIEGSEMAVDDPTEAARSAEILPLVRERLRVIEHRECGGRLLRLVLDDIAANFEGDDPAAGEMLEMVFAIEDALMAAGEVESDFAFVVAGKREV